MASWLYIEFNFIAAAWSSFSRIVISMQGTVREMK
jgi:hypothetical protein